MEKLILVIFITVIVLITILFIWNISKKKKKETTEVISDEEITETLNNDFSDSNLSTEEIIKKFHIFMGYPFSITGLNRRERRIIKQHHTKFLWNWHLLKEEKQSVKLICEHLITSVNNEFVFSRYRNKK